MKIPMTKKGHIQLRDELDLLKKVERPKNIADIAEARAHGDLSENAEYSAAKERQGFIEGRIQEIGGKLADANVISTDNLSTEKVVFGTTVAVIDVDTDDIKQFRIVGVDEANMKNGTISVHSPVAKSLIGREVGDFVEVKTPAKTIEYEITRIFFED
ncbi:Transcription elongation factor GreA [hydrothermal vent metagenome]|uniref:Transcription elongation factor GreA n=1 Tax=hydrothermal vent metagenome TaxID=652676 RepID=A0A3B1CKM4_9ZZZZ